MVVAVLLEGSSLTGLGISVGGSAVVWFRMLQLTQLQQQRILAAGLSGRW